MIRNNGKSEATVYRQPTKNDVYLHWEIFAPPTWKRSTPKTLENRAHTVCSNDNLWKEE